jgi:hypothetical protein
MSRKRVLGEPDAALVYVHRKKSQQQKTNMKTDFDKANFFMAYDACHLMPLYPMLAVQECLP